MGKINKISKSAKAISLNKTGVDLAMQGKLEKALEFFTIAIKTDPSFSLSYYNLGLLYKDQGNLLSSVKSYEKSLKLDSSYIMSYVNLGQVYFELELYNKAFDVYKKALKIDSSNPALFNNLGNVLVAVGRYKEAFDAYKEALTINPKNELAFCNMGIALREGGYFKEALKCFEAVIRSKPDYEVAVASICDTALNLLDWDKLDKYSKKMDHMNKNSLKLGKKPGEAAFFNLIRVPDPKVNLEITRAHSIFVEKQINAIKTKLNFFFQKNSGKRKIRVGYISEGFRNFPTAHNIVGVLENHDKNKFEIFAYSYGVDDKSSWRKRIEKATNFVDIFDLNNQQAAKRIYKDRIDILVDLKGHTRGTRAKIVALRPSPIQVNLLGFAGSTGANYIDYFIGDRLTIPPNIRKYFSEKVVFMPDTYWPTDSSLQLSAISYQRKDFGIPKDAFVFASFNNAYKIDPLIFKTWVNILKRVPNSILWLYDGKNIIRDKVISLAKSFGLNPKKIVLCGKISKLDHLQRFKLADIALDTKRVNGHTTTTDALWVGVPVITMLGNHFMSRVSASMLSAIGLPELITHSLKEYEDLAVELATNSKKLKSIRKSLILNRKSFPLFDTKKYTKNLEKVYLKMIEIDNQGLPPEDIYI